MYPYPKHIIPDCLNRHIRQEHVPNHAHFVRLLNLIEKTPSTRKEIHDSIDKYVKADEFAKGMSVYLIDKYRPGHSRFKIHKDSDHFHNPWIKGECNCPKENDFKCEEDVFYAIVPVRRVKEASIDIKELIKESFSNDKDILNKDKVLEALEKINLRYEHAPTLCNFWHFNIFMYDMKDVKIDANYFAPQTPKKCERVARAVKKTSGFEHIFIVPEKLHKCRMKTKAYKNANTKHNRKKISP